jgi:MinD superfamily P-loop ATPase
MDCREDGLRMKQVVVLSGKGGTGKTSVTASLAHLASREQRLVLVDADVDAANLELVLDPQQKEEHVFMGMDVASIDEEQCKAHGTCLEVCRFEAIQANSINGKTTYRVDTIACEGCATCYTRCPENAIVMRPQQAGLWFRSDTRFGPLFHAHLFAGQPNSGKLVTLIKGQARQMGLASSRAIILVDGPPGIGCPVIAALSGADLALLVVEPTVSGIHDLERIMGTVRHFGVSAQVVINKADLNPRQTREIEAYCQTEGIHALGRIPFDPVMTEAMVQGVPVTAHSDGPVSQSLQAIWSRLRDQVADTSIFLPIVD